MEEKQFQELFLAVRHKDIRDAWVADIKKVLKELLKGEFKDRIKETEWKIILERPKRGDYRAAISSHKGKVYLWINPKNWETNPDFSNGTLKMVLRHELLHVELDMADDEDSRFIEEGKKRGIEFWG